MRTVIVISDTHIASSVALRPRLVQLDDGDTSTFSRGQRWLLDGWESFLEWTKPARDPVLISLGDIVEGDRKHRSLQLVTKNTAVITRMAAEVLDPLVKRCSCSYWLRGTPAHVGKSGTMEERLAEDFTNTVRNPETKAYSWWYLPLELEGVRIGASHYASIGGMPWTRGNSANAIAAKALLTLGPDAPQLILRGHAHRWADSGDNFPLCRAIILPGWTLATEYTGNLSPGAPAEIGGMMVHCDGGKYETEKFRWEPKRQRYFLPPKPGSTNSARPTTRAKHNRTKSRQNRLKRRST